MAYRCFEVDRGDLARMSLHLKPGLRLRSAVCELEVIVVRAPSEDVDLRCGGHAALTADAPRPEGGSVAPGFDLGTQLGKRYTDPDGQIELLCTKAGPSSLSIGDSLLTVKEARPLPSSD
jgi:hypothetical protein